MGHEVLHFLRGDLESRLQEAVNEADGIFHLAGENRPVDPRAFEGVNAELTKKVCGVIAASGKRVPFLLASSTQAALDNPYGQSKRAAEVAVEGFVEKSGGAAAICRLPGVFGKWCRPNYNSVVATFCYNLANDLPIQINDPKAAVNLVYVDDVVRFFSTTMLDMCSGIRSGLLQLAASPVYSISLGDLAEQIRAFQNCRTTLVTELVGTGLTRSLYATYVSYLPKNKFVYDVPAYGDERGMFVEMLKTSDSGQFSFFTAHPGVTRGGHYHHTKTEKFLVIKGMARFGFRHMLTNETYEVITDGTKPQIVETVPGWTHDVTNIGDEEMIVMLWANEVFDRQKPDTYACKV
jgi:UDP-2-acetamido-2,6-beta-L-arabino-hexul-4-ose reductase